MHHFIWIQFIKYEGGANFDSRKIIVIALMTLKVT